jgi:hypothetical protein
MINVVIAAATELVRGREALDAHGTLGCDKHSGSRLA